MSEITLPYGNCSFDSDDLVEHIRQSGRNYIIQGQQACSRANHTKPQSLDYWLRTNYARNHDTKQAVNKVIDQLVATGDFREGKRPCPDSEVNRLCKGVTLVDEA